MFSDFILSRGWQNISYYPSKNGPTYFKTVSNLAGIFRRPLLYNANRSKKYQVKWEKEAHIFV